MFTPRQWLERFRQFTKREHKIDITPLIKGEELNKRLPIPDGQGKKLIQEDCIGGVGPEVLSNKAEYKMEPDSIKVKDLMR